MYELTNPVTIRHLCERFGFAMKKTYGQNFLTDSSVLVKMAEVAGCDGVLEIGPGFGTLTQALCAHAKKVVAVEVDERLRPVLSETLAGYDNVKILWGDVLKLNLKDVLKEHFQDMRVSVAANLPYYVTTPILMELLEGKHPFESITVMVQKEVAQRMVASPGKKDYGALSIAVQYYSEAELIAAVPAEKFVPRPKVDSAVVHLKLRKQAPVDADAKMFFSVVKAAFAQRRKTLINALASSGSFGVKPQVKEALASLGYDENVRGETLSLTQFSDIANIFSNK